MTPPHRVAIVGVGGVFPGASGLEAFWRNVVDGVDTAREAPRGKQPDAR